MREKHCIEGQTKVESMQRTVNQYICRCLTHGHVGKAFKTNLQYNKLFISHLGHET